MKHSFRKANPLAGSNALLKESPNLCPTHPKSRTLLKHLCPKKSKRERKRRKLPNAKPGRTTAPGETCITIWKKWCTMYIRMIRISTERRPACFPPLQEYAYVTNVCRCVSRNMYTGFIPIRKTAGSLRARHRLPLS